MSDSKREMKKRKLMGLARVNEKWNELRRCSSEERKQLLNQHTLTFHMDAVGTGWEYIHFELDGQVVASFRVSYIGPGVETFVNELSNMKEEDCRVICFYDEPGEYFLIFARKKDLLYIQLPSRKKAIWQEYAVFLSQVRAEEKNYYRS